MLSPLGAAMREHRVAMVLRYYSSLYGMEDRCYLQAWNSVDLSRELNSEIPFE